MVNLLTLFQANPFLLAWHGPDRHRVRFALGVGLLSFLLLLTAGGTVWAQEFAHDLNPPAPIVEPSPAEKQLMALTRAAEAPDATRADRARLINATLPLSADPVLAARPFRLPVSLDRTRALECLSQAVYYEAAFEPIEGRRAVAQVVLNRVRHPAFPKTICGVVYETAGGVCQFSFACDGSLARPPEGAAWDAARRVAAEALSGRVEAQVGEATHYHADYVAPFWAPKLAKIGRVGAHIFYRWPGAMGEPPVFAARYTGQERAPRAVTQTAQAASNNAADSLLPAAVAAEEIQGG